MNLKIFINTSNSVSYFSKEQTKEKENTITLTEINEQPIFIFPQKNDERC